jgi:hypothetical protein
MNGSGVKYLEATGLPSLYKHFKNHGSKYINAYTKAVPSTAASIFLYDKFKNRNNNQQINMNAKEANLKKTESKPNPYKDTNLGLMLGVTPGILHMDALSATNMSSRALMHHGALALGSGLGGMALGGGIGYLMDNIEIKL